MGKDNIEEMVNTAVDRLVSVIDMEWAKKLVRDGGIGADAKIVAGNADAAEEKNSSVFPVAEIDNGVGRA